MAWRKLAYIDEVAALTNNTPAAITGAAEAVGNGTAAARDNHVHALGPLTADLDFAQNNALSLVLEVAASGPNSGTEVSGQIYFDSDDKGVYLWQ